MSKRIVLVTTGGTISSGAAAEGVAPILSGDDLISVMRFRGFELPGVILETLDFGLILSANMNPIKMYELAERIQQTVDRPEVDGVVVSHGTGAMEETAFLVSLYYSSSKPVAFTGAMRPSTEPDSDGPRNLRDAIATAASNDANGQGVVVVMSGLLFDVRDATKSHTIALDSFQAPEFGPLGTIDPAGRVRIFRSSYSRFPLFPYAAPDPNVDLIRFFTGMDGRFVTASLECGARGIVVEGSGLGNVNEPVARVLKSAVQRGVVVVMASRCYRGSAHPVYGTPGGGADLARAGVIFSSYLSGLKSRLLLCVALGYTQDVDVLAAIFRGERIQ